MNTEKGVAVASVALLAMMVLASWRVMPQLKEIGEHRREDLHPMRSDSSVALGSPDISTHLAAGNKPFMWKGEKPKGLPPTAGGGKKPPKPIPPKPIPPKPIPPKPMPPVPLPPKPSPPQWKLPIAYVGTIKVKGGGRPRAAIFKDTETSGHIKLTKGQKYRGVKLIEVKVNSVILLNEKGKRFVLPEQK